MTEERVRFGVVGVKGFSQRHVSWIERAAAAGAPVELAAVAAIFSDPETLAEAEVMARKGAKVVQSYDDLLSLEDAVDIITLPVGIHLHAPLAIKALEADRTVYMEKPPAGTVDEVAAIMAAEKASRGRLFVGFQTIYQPATWLLKRQLLAGEIGRLRRIVVTVPWPRPMSYYRRNRWAGRISVDGTFIYDCPMNNSAAHFLNAALFLAGSGEDASAVPSGVEAELYRAAPIESADCTFCRFSTREGVDIVFNGSQNCSEDATALVDLTGDKGRISIVDQKERILAPWTVVDASGKPRVEGAEAPKTDVFAKVAAAYRNPEIREISTLATARMHTVANQMAFLSTTVRDIAPEYVRVLPHEKNGELYAVAGMNDALARLRPEGLLPHESGFCPWSSCPGVADARTVKKLLEKVGVED